MTDRQKEELFLGGLCLFFGKLVAQINENIAGILFSLGTGLIASVITDYNNTEANKEKERTIFAKTVLPFTSSVGKLCQWINNFKGLADGENFSFNSFNQNLYPQINTDVMVKNKNFADKVKEEIDDVVSEVKKLQNNYDILVAVNENWNNFSFEEIDKKSELLNEVWDSSDYDNLQQVQGMEECYKAILKAYNQVCEITKSQNPQKSSIK